SGIVAWAANRTLQPVRLKKNDDDQYQFNADPADDITTLPDDLTRVQNGVFAIMRRMTERAMRWQKDWDASDHDHDGQAWQLARAKEDEDALNEARAAFDKLRQDHQLDGKFQQAAKTIHDARLRTLIVEVAMLIGVSIAGGLAGNAVGSFA